jgi:hypothetical protein
MNPSRSRVTSFNVVALVAAAALLVAGCGIGSGAGTKNANVAVTQNFGAQLIGTYNQPHVPGSETVMSLLQRKFNVGTRYGGGFVESIDGHAGSSSHHDWFYYVNGILAPKGAAATAVNEGDHVWWDLHDWTATETVPAVVGSYPEPFVNGIGGKMFPTVLDCASDVQQACNTVGKSLRKAGVKVSYQLLGGGSGSDSLAVVVGTWNDLRGVIAAELIDSGPAHSGVYAQFGQGGQQLQLDSPDGQTAKTLGSNAGLIAATEQESLNEPTWLITGTDREGVDAAAMALTPAQLRYHFAVAVNGSQVIPIPVSPGQ